MKPKRKRSIPPLSKKAVIILHAERRAEQRYGVRPTQLDLDDIYNQIVSGNATHLGQGNTKYRSMWEVLYKGKKAIVIFSKREGVVTFLTKSESKDDRYKGSF